MLTQYILNTINVNAFVLKRSVQTLRMPKWSQYIHCSGSVPFDYIKLGETNILT